MKLSRSSSSHKCDHVNNDHVEQQAAAMGGVRRISSENDLGRIEESDVNSSSSSSSSPSELHDQSQHSMHSTTHQSSGKSGGASVMSKESSLSMASTETRWVFRLKTAVLLILAVAAIVCGVMTYMVVQRGEIHAFQMEFIDYATEIADLSHQEAYNMVASINTLSATITNAAMTSGSTFPYVTLRNFEAMGILSNNISKVLQVTFAPIVARANQAKWETYALENQDWIDEDHNLIIDDLIANHGRAVTEASTLTTDTVTTTTTTSNGPQRPSIPAKIYSYQEESNMTSSGHGGLYDTNVNNGTDDSASSSLSDFDRTNKWTYAPVWQQSPVPYNNPSIINMDLLSHPVLARVFHGMWETQKPVLSEVMDLSFLYDGAATVQDDGLHPHSFLMEPIYPTFGKHGKNDLVGILVAVVAWDVYFANILHEGANGIILVLQGTCGEHLTYRINGPDAIYLGVGDLHDSHYDALEYTTPFAPFLQHNYSGLHEHCEYELRIFPSADMEDRYLSHRPLLFSSIVVLIFACTTMVFLLFDFVVVLRQNKIVAKAKRTHAIVSSLFPSNIRDRMLQDAEQQQQLEENEDKNRGGGGGGKRKMGNNKAFHRSAASSRWNEALGPPSSNVQHDIHAIGFDSAPIADFFPNTTILFADIIGFTAWSSAREPAQVFMLLEILYHAFDELAKRRRVFKVETIGDCYVAVAGLPDPRPDHAVVMARFARDCRDKSVALFKQLETTLGPDTGDLAMRFGLHSGPVTAGVLRGDKGRFQLFGDSVNTAARMESNGARNRIHCSQETANLLTEAGKKWHCPRADRIYAKGKGELQTYWLEFDKASNPSDPSRHTGSSDTRSSEELSLYSDDKSYDFAGPGESVSVPKVPRTDKIQRLIDWNMDVLCRMLRQVVAHNNASKASSVSSPVRAIATDVGHELDDSRPTIGSNTIVDEVVEVIHLPELRSNGNHSSPTEMEDVTLPAAVIRQVHAYIAFIAGMYPDNPFHNFEHASHVMMSVMKLMSRIVAPSDELVVGGDKSAKDQWTSLHDYTYGINSDPLTQFACAFCALIHDVDHPGVPNNQLVKEKSPLAAQYNDKSVAEQNSVQLAWEHFWDPAYKDFRNMLCPNPGDMQRFRQLVVNLVMATDIMDADFKKLRENRWSKAFQKEDSPDIDDSENTNSREHVNRKATIVLEHIIQASDISHTMQHWHIYRKWNERFFQEMRRAYCNGRSEKDPAEFWYQGEIGFFDFYIIPLAKKLKDCGVFGVSSDEYLNYAQKNREEWVLRGKEVVARMVENFDAIDRVNGGLSVVRSGGSIVASSNEKKSNSMENRAICADRDDGDVLSPQDELVVPSDDATVLPSKSDMEDTDAVSRNGANVVEIPNKQMPLSNCTPLQLPEKRVTRVDHTKLFFV